jgi:predicted Zn-dependent protease
MADIITQDEARSLAQRILEQSTADEAEVRLTSQMDGNTRFAANQATTAGDSSDLRATVFARFGTRVASVTFNRFDDRSIAGAAVKAEQFAVLAPENDEQMPVLGPQSYEANEAFSEVTAGLDANARINAARGVIERASREGLVSTGFIHRVAGAYAVANSAGLFAFHRSTLASYTTTVRTQSGNGSGWAGSTHNKWSSMDAPIELADRAIDKARRSIDPVAVEPGAYTVLLEPTAVGNLVQLLRGALDARAAEEGRSVFSAGGGESDIGTRVIDERLSLISDPVDPLLLDRPFTAEGQPVGRTVWVENGVLTNLATSRFWAAEHDRDPVPPPNGIMLTGGNASTEDLVAGIERGLIVTRFWYVRSVDARTLLYTGLTRDGVFLVENGRITGAVRNLRFNESIIRMLNNVQDVGKPVRVVASESGGLGVPVVVPALVIRDFRFTSTSEAV